METLYLITLHNHAHDGYYRAKCRLSKGEQVVEVSASQRSQLERDPRITVLAISEVKSETTDSCGDESGLVVSGLVSGSIGTESLIPSYYVPVISAEFQPDDQPEKKCKPTGKKS